LLILLRMYVRIVCLTWMAKRLPEGIICKDWLRAHPGCRAPRSCGGLYRLEAGADQFKRLVVPLRKAADASLLCPIGLKMDDPCPPSWRVVGFAPFAAGAMLFAIKGVLIKFIYRYGIDTTTLLARPLVSAVLVFALVGAL
jgi:hypothetical protein